MRAPGDRSKPRRILDRPAPSLRLSGAVRVEASDCEAHQVSCERQDCSGYAARSEARRDCLRIYRDPKSESCLEALVDDQNR